jgi:phosphohistidine phosphatase
MDLLVIRHGKAEPRGPGVEDSERALTPAGRAAFAEVVQGLGTLGPAPGLVLTSPWRRAFETARLLAPLGDPEIRTTPALAESPGLHLLTELSGECAAVVGHEPWLSELLAWLVTGSRQAEGGFLLKKGGVAWTTGRPRPGGMALTALLPPKVLRRLRPR